MSSSVDDWASFALCTRDSKGAANLACLTATDGVPDADDSTGPTTGSPLRPQSRAQLRPDERPLPAAPSTNPFLRAEVPYHGYMVLSIAVPDDLAQELERIGRARGVGPDSVALDVLLEALRRRRLAKEDLGALLDGLAKRQTATELSDEEAMDLAVAEQRAWRAERANQDRR
jgi:hypothetical protein